MRGGFKNQFNREEVDFKLSHLKNDSLQLLFRYIKPYSKDMCLVFLLMVTSSVISVSLPYLTKIIIDNYILKGDVKGLFLSSGIYILLYFVNWMTEFWQVYRGNRVGQKVIHNLRRDLFKKMIYQNMDFHNRQKKGVMISLIVNDTNEIAEFASTSIVNFLKDILTVLGTVIVMIGMDLHLTLITIVPLSIVYILMKVLGKQIRKAYQEVREKIARLNASAEENLSGMRIIMSLSRQSKNTEEFKEVSYENLQANLKAVLLFSLLFPIMTIFGSLSIALIVWWGGSYVLKGHITLGILMAFLSYGRKLFGPLRELSQIYNVFQSSAASLDRIGLFLGMENLLSEPVSPRIPEGGFKGGIQIQNICFGYDKTEMILKDINISIKPGEKIGIVGVTGSGKTTLINLLTRMYDPLSGNICLDGINIKDIAFSELRKTISVVPQETFLFTDSVKNNVAYGETKASTEEIVSVCQRVFAHNFIQDLPKGYDTIVGQEGVRLSGGQKQLLSFARTLLHNPKILILDEATSNIDSYTEKQIQLALDNLMEGRTTIIIAHRFTTLQKVDRICVLEKGLIKHIGTHDELMSRSEHYKELYFKQNVTIAK